jgi:hypothetical protein
VICVPQSYCSLRVGLICYNIIAFPGARDGLQRTHDALSAEIQIWKRRAERLLFGMAPILNAIECSSGEESSSGVSPPTTSENVIERSGRARANFEQFTRDAVRDGVCYVMAVLRSYYPQIDMGAVAQGFREGTSPAEAAALYDSSRDVAVQFAGDFSVYREPAQNP